MKKFLLLAIALLIVPTFSSAHELPPASPFGSERAFPQIGVNMWMLDLSVEEELAFEEAENIIAMWIDDPTVLEVTREGDVIRFRALKPGKAFVRFIWKFDPPENPTPEQLNGEGMGRETISVRITEK